MAVYGRNKGHVERSVFKRKSNQHQFNAGGTEVKGRGGRTFKDVVVRNGVPGYSEDKLVNNEEKKKIEEDEEKYEKTRVVYGDQDEELVAELERSLVGEMLYPIDIVLMEDKLRRAFY